MSKVRLFRHIQLRIGRLELGAPLPETVIGATGATPGAVTIELPAGSFGKAQTITLHLTPDGVLESATFEYKPDADFETMIGDYVSLGAPVRESQSGAEKTVDIARWADDETELMLTREAGAAGSRIRGALSNRRTAS